MNRGDGTFEPQLRFDTDSTPFGLAIGDLTGNGIPDVLTINSTSDGKNSTVSILMGNGDGTFKPARTIPGYEVGTYPLSTIALADLTNNGKLDLIIGGNNDYNLRILFGNGDGTFQPAQTYSAGRLSSSIVFADINGAKDSNGDPITDIITNAVDPGGVSYLLGQGNGTFTTNVNPAENNLPIFPAGQTPLAVVVTDSSLITLADGSVALGPPNGHPNLIVADSGLTTPGPVVAARRRFPRCPPFGMETNSLGLDLPNFWHQRLIRRTWPWPISVEIIRASPILSWSTKTVFA